MHGFNAFLTVSGVASDDVARIDALLADGQRAEVPLVDNVFLIDLPRANLPARLVAYDEEDRVIGVDRPLSDFGGLGRAQPARGRARSLIRVEGYEGATAELFVGPLRTAVSACSSRRSSTGSTLESAWIASGPPGAGRRYELAPRGRRLVL